MARTAAPPIAERLLSKIVVDPATGCWKWTDKLNADGYGRIGVNGAARSAHRTAYTVLVGPIPQGLELDHLCRVRHCINPDHLEPVTHAENIRRGLALEAALAYYRNLTHCKHGHEWTPETTGYQHGGRRRCLACRPRRRAG